MRYSKIALLCGALLGSVAWTSAQAQTATATWQDNSGNACTATQCDQEDRFIIEMAIGSGGFSQVGTTPPNVTTFSHSVSTIPAGTVLTYRVCAENTAGRTCSTAAKYTVPTAPPAQVVLPIPPGAIGVTFVFP